MVSLLVVHFEHFFYEVLLHYLIVFQVICFVGQGDILLRCVFESIFSVVASVFGLSVVVLEALVGGHDDWCVCILVD